MRNIVLWRACGLLAVGQCCESSWYSSARFPINMPVATETSQSLQKLRINSNRPETSWLHPSISLLNHFLSFNEIYVIVNSMRNLANLAPHFDSRAGLTWSIMTGLSSFCFRSLLWILCFAFEFDQLGRSCMIDIGASNILWLQKTHQMWEAWKGILSSWNNNGHPKKIGSSSFLD